MGDLPAVLAVIPARGGSKGLPGKNIRELAGLPLIGHSLRAAELVPEVRRCVVSTDSEEIAGVATVLGGEVPFLRPAELAQDDTPMAPVLRHALEWVTQEGQDPDLVLLLDPTSPARRPEDISAAIARLRDEEAWDGIVSVSQPTFHPAWVGVRASPAGRMERYFSEGVGVTRRQELDRFLRVNGNFYVWRADFIRRMQVSWMDEGVHGVYEIPESLAFAIDYLDEFERLEALVEHRVIELPWLTDRAVDQ